MKKILVVPDKFKGSLTALQVCDAVEEGIKQHLSDAEITKIPLADGGEGSLEILEASIKFNKIPIEVNNPLFKKIKSYYGLKNSTAYIEMALASGLQLLSPQERNPVFTTTFGTGEMIVDAIKRGATKIYLFIGGSATNDGGMGIASALGYKFYDKLNKELKPIGESLSKIKSFVKNNLINKKDVDIIVLTDVDNELYGENGAAFVYAKQKGASEKEIKYLDNGLKNFSTVVKNTFGKDVSKIPGGGAAGGVGGGMVAFFDAKIKSGIESIMELLNINEQIKQSDFIITGEGKLDEQTLKGKVVHGIIEQCKKQNKPFGIVCGDVTILKTAQDKLGAFKIKPIKTSNVTTDDAIKNAYKYLKMRAAELTKEFFN